jgi:hypothetical protein
MSALAFAAVFALGLAPARAQDHAHPDVAIRIDQAALELPEIVAAERKALAGKINNFSLELKDDGLHTSGDYRVPILPDVHFEAVTSFVWRGPNVFELRVHKVRVLFFNVTRTVLDTVRGRLEQTLKGAFSFQDLGEQPDGSQALRVTVNMSALMPALPALVLSDITTRDKLIIFKARMP